MSYKKLFFLLTFLGCFAYNLEAFVCANDKQALSYSIASKNSYIAIVWPRGTSQLSFITNGLIQESSIKYLKKISLTHKDLFLLYRYLHPSISLKNSKRYFHSYIPAGAPKIITIYAILLEADMSLAELMALKKQIRDGIGCGHKSLHINDFHSETVEAAQVVFNNALITKISQINEDADVYKIMRKKIKQLG